MVYCSHPCVRVLAVPVVLSQGGLHMKDLSIVRIRAGAIPSGLLDSWAKLYCRIWKEPPWNEDFWRPESVAQDLSREMLNPDAAAFLAVQGERVIGFTHGYSVSCEELREIAGNNLLGHLFEERGRVYYVDELGVAASYRGRGISLCLTAPLIEHARSRGIGRVTLRTDIEAPAARHVYRKLGFTELPAHDAAHPSRTYWFLDLFFHNL